MKSSALPRCASIALSFFLASLLPGQETRLANLATRGQTGVGDSVLTAGFVIGAGANKQVVIRAVGPALASFGLTDLLADPFLTLVNSAGATIATNDNWLAADAATMASAGAFALPAGSKDAVIVTTLAPGSYTAQVSGVGSANGLVIVEVYAVGSAGGKLINISTRGFVGTDSNVMIPGISISPGTGTRRFIVRASGPALAAFGLGGTLSDPRLVVTNDTGTQTFASNDDWGTPVGAGAATAAQLSAAFGPAGAFAFAPGSKDSAVLVDLAPGNYTIQVSGVAGATGLSLVEIYDITPPAAPTVTIAATIASAERSGSKPGEYTFTRTGDTGQALTVNYTIGGTAVNGVDYPLLSGAITIPAGAASAKLTLAPNSTVQSSATQTATLTIAAGGANYVVGSPASATVSIAGSATVTIAATIASADKSGSKPGEFTFTRTGDTTQALTVNYVTGGTAVNGFDYPALLGSIVIPAGASSVKLALAPNPAVLATGGQTATLTIATGGNSYVIGSPASATVNIADSPSTLYISNLRPETNVTGSSASGTATILVNSAGTLANVSVSFAGLSSAQTGAHLRISPSGDFVFNLPAGQISNFQWTLAPTGTYTTAALLAALKSGNIYVGLDTANNPAGEVRGTFIAASGAQDFTPPAAPPALPTGTPTAADAARLLMQATFGPKRTEIATVQSQGIDGWITAQLALPFTSHRTAMLTDFRTYGGGGNGIFNQNNRQAAWWNIVLTAPDQLRQRVALALSEIMVVSDVSFDENATEGLANYYDILGNAAFGNFRTLLENVTRSPIMGIYLSSLRNSKADPITGTSPDENYAREVMQLFSIGLNLLRPDGTLKLDTNGLPIPSYNQATVTEMAKVFTGWSYASTKATPTFRGESPDYVNPMQLFPAYHDDGVKNIVNGVVVAPGQGGVKDLQQALDALFLHPNTGPFIAKQLIQRLVTSNPTPAYVYRVAQKFENNGSGVRGDLGAVVRAILTDYEARSVTTVSSPNFGKLKEPLIRATGLLRTFGATPASGRYVQNLLSTQVALAQASLRAPTVFNFFHPDYVLPGALASAGLVAPEFEITDAAYAISVPNFLRGYIFNTVGSNPDTLVLNLSYEQTLAATPSALLDHLALVMCGGNLPQAVRDRVTTMLTALPAATTALERVQRVLLVLSTTSAGATQK